MVQSCAQSTTVRKTRIVENIKLATFTDNSTLKEFGIEVGTNFSKVEAVILKAPNIQYANKGVAKVQKGFWNIVNNKLLEPVQLKNWVIVNTHGNDKDLPLAIEKFMKILKDKGEQIGIKISSPRDKIIIRKNTMSANDIRKVLEETKAKYDSKNDPLQLIVVIMNTNIQNIYNNIKSQSELNVGVLTQCIKSDTISRNINLTIVENIILKVNAKLKGINHTLLADSLRPKILCNNRVMIIGADVTHPAPGTNTPSIAAVAASYDSKCFFKYNLLFRLQRSKQEIILDLENIISEQLGFFNKENKCYPEILLYYRDGVSEGQFREVLDVELKSIKTACSKISKNIGITFMVVQKRHHTRFFPQVIDGDGTKNNNVVPGTLVDSEITHPTEMDFYLVSHQSIQGTARPTKYHLLYNDNNVGDEELERVTYFLCHVFARCNRAVSYPAPTYYAHLGAFRARAYFEGQISDSEDLERLQYRFGRISEHIKKNSPMYFI